MWWLCPRRVDHGYLVGMGSYSFSLAGAISEPVLGDWNRLNTPPRNPFVSREFLALLEDSGALTEAGWTPVYALVSLEGRLVACAPFYVTRDPTGQFTWDHGLEELAQHFGTRWYPKLVGTVPFTPAPVWKILSDPAEPGAVSFLLSSMKDVARSGGFSGLHLQWIDQGSVPDLQPDSWIPWDRQVYRWENRGYPDFDAFINSFSKNMRRNISRDRAAVLGSGFRTEVLSGREVPASFWARMKEYYARTNDKFGPWAARFLPPAFFDLAPRYIADQVRFSAAFRVGQTHPHALALLFEGDEGLWGRYWGSGSDEPGLHFEVCYYQPIEWAIGRKLVYFDPGMGGHHKARRGFRALTVPGFHTVFDPHLASVFRRAVREASKEEAGFAQELNRDLPFKSTLFPKGTEAPDARV